MADYDTFYRLYPRKQAGAAGRAMWNKLTDEEKRLALAALPAHIKLWEAEGREKQHIPLPASWLNPKLGRRWEDEIELPKPKEAIPAWWTSDQGVMAKGQELGLSPRPGESMYEFKGRVQMYIQQSRVSNIGRGDSGNF